MSTADRPTSTPLRICVYCASSTEIDAVHTDLAAQLGTALAARGHSLVTGGGAVSSMGAVARAARAGGAHTLGVIPTALLELEVGDQDADELVTTTTMRERKGVMDDRADAFIALAGGLGTLEELLEIWVGRVLRLHTKPVIVLDPTGLFDLLRQQVEELVRRGFVRPSARDAITWATGVEQALDLAEQVGTSAPEPAPEEVAEGE